MKKSHSDYIGKKFNTYTVISIDESKVLDDMTGKCYYYICRCSCGKEKSVRSTHISRLKSCSCHEKQNITQNILHSYSNYSNRDSMEYSAFCKSVYKRDGYKCVICGKKGRLNAHHLDGWSWFYQGRFDINNAVTLCSGFNGCHEKFHKIYGKRKNTLSQFEQFASVYRTSKTTYFKGRR